ncbi:hypothetical protein AMJ40_03140, partial [candidate division TA06 bacterium DG_26]
MSSRKNIRVSVAVAAMLCFGVSAYGTVWHVHPDSAISSIQAGIDFSSEGDTILVYPETYYENINLGRKNIVLASLFLTTADTSYIKSTVIDGNSSGNVVVLGYQQDSTTVISGFTIQNGYGMSGCGIDCLARNPTISHCIIRDNSGVRDGSGIRCGGGSPIITHCTIIRNGLGATMYAAGIWCHSLSDPIISDCTIKENGNAQCLGGGIECLYSNPSLTNLVVTGNAAYEGGGILCYLSNPTLTNVTISDNIGYHSGGGIQCWESSNPVLVNTILWNNKPQEIHVHSGSAIATYSDIQGGWPGQGNIDVDPLFADPDHGIYEVFSGSPCIDAGDPGILDPDGTRSDIGVFYPEHPDSLIRIVAPDAATDEGEELICNVSAVDLGGGSIDSIRVIAGLPEGAAFEDLGGGEALLVRYPWFCSAPDSYTVIFKVWDNEGDWNVRGATIKAEDVNRPPVIVCPEPIEVDECALCTLVVLCSDPDSCDADLVIQGYSDVPEEYVTADWTGGDWANPNVDTLVLQFGYDFTCCHDSTVRIRFISTDNHGSEQWMAPSLERRCWTEITVHDVPRPPTVAEQPEPYHVEKGDTDFFTIGYTDPDLCDTVPTHMTFSYEDSDIAGLDYEAGIDASTGVFWFYAGLHFVPPRAHDMSFTITFTVTDHTDLSDSEEYVFIIDEPEFTLEVKKVFAWPGQQHVRVPVFLSNPWDEVGGWNILMEYD